MARTTFKLVLTDIDKQALEAALRSCNTSQSLARRTQIVLKSFAGESVDAISDSIGISTKSVYKWRNRFIQYGLDGLFDLPRSGQPKKLDEDKIKEVLKLTMERIPHEATNWSVRLMAKYAGITAWQVMNIWSAANLKPHCMQDLKICNDPWFAAKVIDVVGLYLNPPDNAIVLMVDENAQNQDLEKKQTELKSKPVKIERRTRNNRQNWTTCLHTALNILTNGITENLNSRFRIQEFIDFILQIEKTSPNCFDLHAILYNSGTQNTNEVQDWLRTHRRIRLHYIPTNTMWLKAAECWLSGLERRTIYYGILCSVEELRDKIQLFLKLDNSVPAKVFKWSKSEKL